MMEFNVSETLLTKISNTNRIAEEYLQLLQSSQLKDAALSETLKTLKLRFLVDYNSVLKQISETSQVLTPDELEQLTHLQGLIEQMASSTLVELTPIQSESSDQIYQKACLFLEHGQIAKAESNFIAVLKKEPDHFAALNELAKINLETGNVNAAYHYISQAVAAYPQIAIGHLNFADILVGQCQYDLAKQHYHYALDLQPDLFAAHQGLAIALAGLGEYLQAHEHRDIGFKDQSVIFWPYRGEKPGITLLVLSSALGGNIPIKHILDKQTFETTVILTEYYPLDTPLPAHQLMINLVGDADLCQQGLAIAEKLQAKSDKPIINPPALVRLTGRLDNAYRLASLPGVITPKVVLLPRASLLSDSSAQLLVDYGFRFPLLLRSPGFHTGQFFVCVSSKHDLTAMAANMPDQDILVMELLEARNKQGDYHKYRVMFVDGKLYPLHLAISKHWKVHYFSADMADSPDFRQSEADFLQDMSGVLGAKAMPALENIRQALALDYGGIDFAVNANGDIVVFEANATMAVHRPEVSDKWQYRQIATEQILTAVRNMIISRSLVSD